MVKKMVVQVVKVTINRDSSDAMKGTEIGSDTCLLHERMMKIPAWDKSRFATTFENAYSGYAE